MHDCPGCNQACDCDGEDHWNDAASEDCTHDCDEFDEPDRDDEDDRTFVFGGACVIPGCINFCNHFAPDECETEAAVRAWARHIAREARNQRRRRFRDEWTAAIRRAKRVQRRNGSDHRLTLRAWARAGREWRRKHDRHTPYFTKRATIGELPW
jgi:hypothetical protein